jgi:hypothetical protein
MNRAQLKASRALWAGRERVAKAQHTAALNRHNLADVEKWGDKLREARKQVAHRDEQLHALRPRAITSSQLGLRFQYVWGSKGQVYRGAGHYTAGRRVANAKELMHEMRSDHAFHMGKGWGGLSYEVMIADDGTIGYGNPVSRKSAAVAGQNTGLVSICCPGTTGDRMTSAQKRSVRWYLANAHTRKVPSAYRLPKPARRLTWRVHKEWPGQSTACPGDMTKDYKEIWHGG